MIDSFEFTLHSPLTKEDWDKISDVEHENTLSVTFQTPQGRQVRYIKCEVLDKIRAEILAMMPSLGNWMYEEGDIEERTACEVIIDVLAIIDKYKAEGSEE